MQEADYLIIGAGIVGMTIAYELRKRHPHATIIILEKESDVAQHASGRNSGVLHAGFYYTADSLKAKFCVEGNRRMKAFCREHGLKLNECQKLVVAKNEEELPGLHELYRRGQKNGVDLKLITAEEARQFDPNVKTHKEALLSPSTASVDPKEVCHCLKQLLQKTGVGIITDQKVTSIANAQVKTQDQVFTYKQLVNAAGLYADRLAHQVNVGKNYVMIPFKGIYLKYEGDKNSVRTNIYPVPNLKRPFLGVHFTKTVNNDVKIGPTAMPAFWRENYKGLSKFSVKEFCQVVYYSSKLFLTNAFNFRRLAISEIKKYFKPIFIKESKVLVKRIDNNFVAMPAGIRAQLMNRKTSELVMDFLVEKQGNATHILNAVSPGFTCAFPFADYVVDIVEGINNERK